MPLTRVLTCLALAAVVASGPACNCQRPENIEAKRRLGEPLPPDPVVKAAAEKLDANQVGADAALRARVNRMTTSELAVRLKSFTFTAKAELSFERAGQGVRSAEKAKIVQGGSGDFSVDTETGDGSEQHLAFVNDVFFLRNNNGHWRMSRDPTGERNSYRNDAGAVWKSFFDLFEHTLQATPNGHGNHEGRDVVKYKLALKDESAAARAAGAQLPPLPAAGPDGEKPEEKPGERNKRIVDRISKWRERSKPAGGEGDLYVDSATGAPLYVRFTGALLVGDGPEPARLAVQLEQSVSGVGKDVEIRAPKDAVEEVVRRKLPTSPRTLLEDEGIVKPIPTDAGPADAKKKAPAAKPAGPDEETE